MMRGRLVSLLLSVSLTVCCLTLTASAAGSYRDIPNNVTFYPNPVVFGKMLTTAPTYDFVLVRVTTDSYMASASLSYREYTFYFCKNSVVTKDAQGRWQSNGVLVPRVVVYDGIAGVQGDGFRYYPYYLGYINGSESTVANVNLGDTGTYFSWIIDSSDFKFITYDPGPDPPKPDPPPEPDPQYEPPPVVIPPVNMEFVPWDTNKMGDFDEYIRRAIGVAVNVGFILFALVLAVYVMIRIIRMFERTSGNGED